jgi:microcystin degradation protein MlrC
LIEGLVAGAQPGGITTRHAWETLRDELLADLRAALPVEMVLLGLHGAMVAEGCDDCEGELLQRVRALVGPGVVVGAELDPHNHLSAAMVGHADLLIAFKQYPHTDILERAFELVDLCAAPAAGRIRPVASVADCAMIVTCTPRASRRAASCSALQALEGRDGVLSISVTHGFAWGDVADMGTRLLVYTDGRREQGDRLARRLADELIALRDALARRGWTSTPRWTPRWPRRRARWSSPTAPTTRAVVPPATPPSCCGG